MFLCYSIILYSIYSISIEDVKNTLFKGRKRTSAEYGQRSRKETKIESESSRSYDVRDTGFNNPCKY